MMIDQKDNKVSLAFIVSGPVNWRENLSLICTSAQKVRGSLVIWGRAIELNRIVEALIIISNGH